MNEPSSYLAYLPPVLQSPDEEGASPLRLGDLLKVFEKVLTGIPDGLTLTHRPSAAGAGEGPAAAHDPSAIHEHLALTAQIADLHRLFDPWTTPAEFLPWLASWVALEFPTLQGVPLWEEYQRRKVTAEIAQIYRLRGRRSGLNQYLDLYAVGQARPRVCVDDGGRLLAVDPAPGQGLVVSSLVSQGPVVVGQQVRSEGLTRPWCVATAKDGSLVVGDVGLPDGTAVRLPSRVWHLDATGRYELAGTPPRPAPLAPETANLRDVVAVAVRPDPGGGSDTAYVLTRTGRLYAIPAPFRGVPATLLTTLSSPGTAVWMVAMAVDPGTGDLVVLDRGGRPPQSAAPSVAVVRPNPLSVTRTALTGVVEPLSVRVEGDGRLLVGDGGDQEPAGPDSFPGNVVRVTRTTSPWTLTRLLPAANPLVAPTAIARTPDGTLYVLDAGLKPFTPSATDPFICPVAEHAAIYAVDVSGASPSVVRTTDPGQFVYPTGMVSIGTRLVVCDPGQPEVSGLEPFWARVRPFEFAVTVHFTTSRLSEDPTERKRVLDQAVGNITSIVNDQKPAHTVWTLITSIL